MRIGFCTYPLQSAHKIRGIGYYTDNLLKELKKNQNLEIIEFSELTPPNNVDVVHYPWFDFYFRTLPLHKKAPTVVTIHDTIPLIFPKQYPVGLKGKINFKIQKFSLSNCKLVIVNSLDSKKGVTKYLSIPEAKVDVTYFAQNQDFKVLSESQKLRIKKKFNLPDKFLLFVGDANYTKNLPFLIEGYKKLLVSYPDLGLVLVGEVYLKKLDNIDHPELASLKLMNNKITEYGLDQKVIRPGRLETDDLVGFYNLATMYVQPSLYEGFGIPILEAFASGCPVISSNAGALPEVVGEAGILFDPTKLEHFVKLVDDILQDKNLRSKLSKSGLIRADKFSWEKTADQTVKLYEQASQ